MKVVFRTNIDHYKTNCFPTEFNIPPRIGETVMVAPVFEKYYRDKKLPVRLEVVDVIWGELGVVCELHYKKIDIEMARLFGVNLL